MRKAFGGTIMRIVIKLIFLALIDVAGNRNVCDHTFDFFKKRLKTSASGVQFAMLNARRNELIPEIHT